MPRDSRDKASGVLSVARGISLVFFSVIVACGEAPPPDTLTPQGPRQATPPPALHEFEGSTWGHFHSTRFRITLPLPDGKTWRIDDHVKPFLTAYHPDTGSHVTLYSQIERELVNHKSCEDGARAQGLVPDDLSVVESTVTIGPDAYDSRIVVGIGAKKKGLPLVGHLFLFGAYVRTCLFLHLETEVETDADEPKLSSRLAAARVTMINELKIDPPRTTEDSDVPRQR